jgi:protein phosphatase
MERMTIGEFAREAGLTAKALRLYDELALIAPAEVDPVSGYRYYRTDQRMTLSSTLTAAWLLDDRLAVAHIGDSRAWLLRDGELSRLTTDHTEVQSLIDDGSITEDEARSDPRRNLLNRALAAAAPGEPDVVVVPVRDGDRVVLTTDGVHAVVEPDRLRALLGAGSPQESVDAVAAAVEEAGAPDNYAVVVADLG